MAKAAAPKKPLTKSELLASRCRHRGVQEAGGRRAGGPGGRDQEEPRQQGRGRDRDPRAGEDREEEVPARKAQKGVPNPFKPGELMDRAAKPAYNKVKVRALKLLKEMAK